MGHAVRDKSTARCWICPRGHAARRVCDKSGREGRIWADLPAQGRADPPPPNADPTPRRRARTRPPPPRPDPTPAAKAGWDTPGRRDRPRRQYLCISRNTGQAEPTFPAKAPWARRSRKTQPTSTSFPSSAGQRPALRGRARLLPVLSCLYSCATQGGARGPQRLIVCETGRRSPGFCSWTLVGQAPGVIKEHGGPPRTVL
jgi:hypothetical protein